MKKLFLFISLIIWNVTVHAQNAIAKIKYEQAEEAFAKNDFFTTLVNLDEAEKLLGETNPKIMYLRIMAQSKLMYKDSAYLPELKKNTAFFLKKYDNNSSVEEKYKEVYLVSENLKQYEPDEDYSRARKFYEEKNYEQALVYANKAAAKGYGKAMHAIGMMYEYGYGVTKDYTEAKNWYQRSADKGIAQGYYNLGRLYYHGLGVGQNYTESLNLFLQAISKNLEQAYIGAADTYYYGLKDYAKALEYYKKPAQNGNMWSMYMMGMIYYYGINGAAQNYPLAMEWFTKAAEKGSEKAMNFIGVMFKSGFGVAKDAEKAAFWYLQAAEKNDYYSLGNLALMYENGDGVKKDRKKAKELRERQATAVKY